MLAMILSTKSELGFNNSLVLEQKQVFLCLFIANIIKI